MGILLPSTKLFYILRRICRVWNHKKFVKREKDGKKADNKPVTIPVAESGKADTAKLFQKKTEGEG